MASHDNTLEAVGTALATSPTSVLVDGLESKESTIFMQESWRSTLHYVGEFGGKGTQESSFGRVGRSILYSKKYSQLIQVVGAPMHGERQGSHQKLWNKLLLNASEIQMRILPPSSFIHQKRKNGCG